MTKEEHYEQAKRNVVGRLNERIGKVVNIPVDVMQKHPVVEIQERDNSLHQKTPFVVVRGVLRAFATALPVSYDGLLKAMPDDANQKKWDMVIGAMLFSRLIFNKKFINEVIEAVQTDERIPANRVEQTVLAVVSHYTLISWQLLKGINSETMATGFQQYDGLHEGMADLGRLQHIVPFTQNDKLREFHDWLQPFLSKFQGMEQSVLFNNLLVAQGDSIHNHRSVGLSIPQIVVLYINSYWATQELNMLLDGGIRKAIAPGAVEGILVRYTLMNIYQSYQSVGWINPQPVPDDHKDGDNHDSSQND